eukprot:TRINITY_DN5005_c0_g1_i2.p1 TRINITY_DN5005_c0_g1~~TRINITY_DN5005_c0_g1_i2.p1  ORF type:complete len:804 (-),score=148.63 TRINITY_DN5005_c0_g1_i2:468-2879(-)
MDKARKLEWLEAQKIVISVDLVVAAKRQLQFLAAVDRNRCLYEGPVLVKAINRYKTFWLPLLAKHAESVDWEGPLVVPLDCEWIWHCHRLNPADCEKFYGRILDNQNVESVVRGVSTQKTEEAWSRLYPEEPFELEFSSSFSEVGGKTFSGAVENITYDLVSAVKRQSSFFYQVSRPSMHDDHFLEGALARYKGFLHLIKRNIESSRRRFCVPTYDIDLIWHSHQLNSISYCKDLVDTIGKVLEHDDMDSDRTKGKKLDTGFLETTKQWEETFGWRYWRAGAMYRGNAPSPITHTPWSSSCVNKPVVPCSEYQKCIRLPETKVVEVLLEIVGIRNLPSQQKGNLFVSFSKNQPDVFFNTPRKLSILSECSEKQVAAFQCEPTGELVLALMSSSPSNFPISKPAKTVGTISISLQDLFSPVFELCVDKWFELTSPNSGDSKPISLRIAVSFTNPSVAPHVLHLVRSFPFPMNNCLFPLPGRFQQLRHWTRVMDDIGNEVINIQMRNSKKADAKSNSNSDREVVGVIGCSGETIVLAELVGTVWSLMDSRWSLQLEKKPNRDGHIFELRGDRLVKLFPGRKLEYEAKNCERRKNERDFMTVVEFSTEYPYGKSIALFNLKFGLLKVNEEWFVLLGIVLEFILSDILRKEGHVGFLADVESVDEMSSLSNKGEVFNTKEAAMARKVHTVVTPTKGGGCSGGCGSGCGNSVKSSGCGSGCGGGCGNMVKSGGCGSGCGGGCGNMVRSGGCGSGCGGGCGSGCGNMIRSGGCGGCGGGVGCGNSLAHEKIGCGCGGCGADGTVNAHVS